MTSTTAPRFHLGYRPSLDGLRGVAILLVLLNHGGILGDGFGFIGVNTFFVLSGFLITTLLTLEWQESGKISLRAFYLRRALRLLPALVTMLAAFTIYVVATKSGKELRESLYEVLYALFYFMNWAKVFVLSPTLQLAHTWSLSLEEQFYFCWPLLLLFLLKKTSRSSALCWVALGVIVSVSIRIFLLVGSANVPYNSPDRLMAGLDTRADSLLLGCMVGMAATANMLSSLKINSWMMSGFSIASFAGLFALACFRTGAHAMVYAGWFGASICAGVVILQLIITSPSPMHSILENPALVYVGKISYGLYVWHFTIEQVMVRYGVAPPDHYWPYWISIFPVAMASYYLIESPCLRLKKRFQKV